MTGFYQPVSSITHLMAALITISTGYILVRRGRGNTMRIISMSIFILCFIFMFMMSGIYHALQEGMARDVFRRLDYAAIFTMISGTATPIHIILFRGWWRWGMLLFLWTIAIVGLLLTIILLDKMPEWFTLTVFISMGWSALISMIQAWKYYGFKNIALAIYGGIAYSIGAAIDFFKTPQIIEGFVGPHEIFHVFVVCGAAMHWKLIYDWAQQPTHKKLIFMVREKSQTELIARAVGENIMVNASSRKDLRKKVKEQLEEKFHPILIPQKIRFRFYRDTIMDINK